MNRAVLAVAIILVLLFSLANVMSPASGAENSWVTKASIHFSRTDAGAAAVNGTVYVMGGSQRYNTTDNDFSYMSINATEAYNSVTDAWTVKAPMPTSREGFGVAVYQNKIYCTGGRSVLATESNITNATEVYDTETNSWQTKTSMQTARYGIEANVVDGKFYLIGGYELSPSSFEFERGVLMKSSPSLVESTKVEVYDPVTDMWTTGSPMPIAVGGYASAIVDGKVYVISGLVNESAKTNLTQIYDPKTDKWSFGAPIPMSVTAAAAGATTGEKAAKAIYVIGGANVKYPLNGQDRNQVYFPQTNSWSAAASMPIDRAGSAIAVVNDTLYVVGGGHNIFTMDSKAVMQYTPFINSSAEIEPFPMGIIVISVLVGVAVVVSAGLALLIYLKKK